MMPQDRFIERFDGQCPRRLDLADAGRRAEMVQDAVRPAEAANSDNFLVVNPLAAIARFMAMGNVPLAGDRAESNVGRHIDLTAGTRNNRRDRSEELCKSTSNRGHPWACS